MPTPGDQLGVLDGQGDGDVAATGADSGDPAAADAEQQSLDGEHDGQGEPDGGYLLAVHQDPDRGPLIQRDLVLGHADQFGASGCGQRPPGGGDDVLMLTPAAYQHVDQVDFQQGSRGGGRLLRGGFPGRLGQARQGVADFLVAAGRRDLVRQGPGRVRVGLRAEEQIEHGGRVVLGVGRHCRFSPIVMVAIPGSGSKRTV
jgi:hypothetical protein